MILMLLKSNIPRIYQRILIKKIPKKIYDCIIVAVKHDDFKKIPLKKLKEYGVKKFNIVRFKEYI